MELLKELNLFLDKNLSLEDVENLRRETENDYVETMDIESFIMETEHYLYDLVFWGLQKERQEITQNIIDFCKSYGFKSVYDYGCGIGLDTIPLMESGLKIYYYDLPSKHLDFLRFRMHRRGIERAYVELDSYFEVDLINCIAVLEHVKEPLQLLKKLLTRGKYISWIIDLGPDALAISRLALFPIREAIDSGKSVFIENIEIQRMRMEQSRPCLFKIIR